MMKDIHELSANLLLFTLLPSSLSTQSERGPMMGVIVVAISEPLDGLPTCFEGKAANT